MPLYWSIDSRTRLVTLVGDGPVTRADMDAYIDAVDGAGAIGYRKLYDGRNGMLAMAPDELLAIGARFRSYHARKVGPLALILPDDQLEAASRLLGVLASGDRPLRLFKTLGPAQRWLDGFVVGTPRA